MCEHMFAGAAAVGERARRPLGVSAASRAEALAGGRAERYFFATIIVLIVAWTLSTTSTTTM
jgi:hypothetical protein